MYLLFRKSLCAVNVLYYKTNKAILGFYNTDVNERYLCECLPFLKAVQTKRSFQKSCSTQRPL